MFYSLDILVKKNGKFALIWQYIHDPKRSVKMKKELVAIDVKQSCKDLEKYIPVGKYSKTELSNKMSLYLLAQLFYGIVIVHSLQASAFLDNLQQLAKSLLRIPQPERAKRQRADGEAEGGAAAKKRRVSRPGINIMLDVTQPRAYMEEHHQVQQLRDPLLELDDDNFEVHEDQGRPTVLDWDMEGGGVQPRAVCKVSIAEISLGGEEVEKPVRISVAEYLASPEALRRPTGQFDVSGLNMVADIRRQQLEFSRTQELVSPRLAELQERMAAERNASEEEEEDEQFILEPFIKPTPTRRKRKQPRVQSLYDEEPEVEVQELEQTNTRLVRTFERAIGDMERSRRLHHQRQMILPHPKHLSRINFRKLNALFESVMDQVKERPLSFQQATRTNPDELRRKRRLEFEIVSWDSEGASVEAYTPWVAANGGDQKGPTVHVSSLTPSVIMPDESRRPAPSFVASPEGAVEPRASEAVFPGGARASSVEPARREAATPVADVSGAAREQVVMEEELQTAGSPPLATATTVQQGGPEEEEEVRPSARRLLKRIHEATAQSHTGVIKFSDVCPNEAPRKERAREFFNLLSLLKHRDVKVKQKVPYDIIRVKCRGQSAAVSRGEVDD